jgi:crotonobetainyl-CoA:carnitine CoA-transferase CaiB-like acyl-CoA transferase
MAGPLAGIRIIDLSTVVAGPLAAQTLADQGADVIKVEPVGLGDISRYVGATRGGYGGLFLNVNRNKRSLAIDLKKAEGVEALRKLAATADVVLHNYRPGVMDRLGIGYETLKKDNPGLIYASISGFGETGPYSDQRAYDPVIQAMTGMCDAQAESSDGKPRLIHHIVCDKSTGLTCAQAITAALLARERGGGGQELKVSLLDAGLYFFWPDGMWNHSLAEPERRGAEISDIYKLWETSDGWVMVAALSDAEYAGWCRAFNKEALIHDERFAAIGDRLANWDDLFAQFESVVRSLETKDVLERLAREDVPAGPVNSRTGVFEDSQIKEAKALLEFHDPRFGTLRLPRPPALFGETPSSVDRLPPRLGEHSREVLREAGLSDSDIDKLLEAKVMTA